MAPTAAGTAFPALTRPSTTCLYSRTPCVRRSFAWRISAEEKKKKKRFSTPQCSRQPPIFVHTALPGLAHSGAQTLVMCPTSYQTPSVSFSSVSHCPHGYHPHCSLSEAFWGMLLAETGWCGCHYYQNFLLPDSVIESFPYLENGYTNQLCSLYTLPVWKYRSGISHENLAS